MCTCVARLQCGLLGVQVGKSKLSVETGVNELVQAKTYQKSSRRWMCWATAVVLVVVVIIVVAVVIAVKT